MGSIQDLIERLMHREVLKIIVEDQADAVLQPHDPETRQQNKEAGLKRSIEILGDDGLKKLKIIIRTLILKPLLIEDIGYLVDDEVWREAMDVGIYPDEDEGGTDWDDVISTIIFDYLEKIRAAAEEILDA